MKDVFERLATDFLSTIVFLVIYLASGNIVLATSVAIAGAIGQVHLRPHQGARTQLHDLCEPRARHRARHGHPPDPAIPASCWQNPRSRILRSARSCSSAAGCCATCRRWWPRRFPEYVTIAGYSWAALMFVLGAGTIAVAATGDLWLWGIYVSFVAVGAKILAFAVQYVGVPLPRRQSPARPRRGRHLRRFHATQDGWACTARWAIPPDRD